MSVNELLQLADEIANMPLTESFKEQLTIQAADLVRFKEAYPGTVAIVTPFAGPLSVIEADGKRVALSFCSFANINTLPRVAGRFSHIADAAECWLVLVNDGSASPLHDVSTFCNDTTLLKNFTRIFILNFCKSSLHQL